ncbi:DUF1311 domain-containing protein [Paracoccus caeni]|uniref:DUF1311 domain-containing protein n=1 Tax=Paracoccus caeni TaxID=657651 RepID=A0A934SBN1_9RHOB|nr:lysozyme inhibitor LprI family protein [Paracoccus caeni]MBK4215841.1 DUF1311 domain-containing protein [Paracoccus caeni]
MLKYMVLSLATLTLPAMAQENLQFDAAVLETCLDKAGQDEKPDRESCIGLASDQCMESDIGQTTMGMSLCLDREREVWDAKLNESYQTLMAYAVSNDVDMEELGSAAEKQVPFLQKMQRNWISYRDAACQFERSQWGGGTGGGPSEMHCLMVLTARQYLWLQQYLNEGA